MQNQSFWPWFGALSIAVACITSAAMVPPPHSETAEKLMRDGNFREAYQQFRQLALDPQANKSKVGDYLHRAVDCLSRLGRTDEIDAFREKVIEVHSSNWRLLQAAAQSYMQGPHFGYIVAGEFHRGGKRGGGRYVDVFQRDRVRALQLMHQALLLVRSEPNRSARASFYLQFARYLIAGRHGEEAWRLQHLTDLTTLPDYEDAALYPRWGYRAGNTGAPVDEAGHPVFHHLPPSFEKARSDGERWRWLLQQAAEADPNRAAEVQLLFADFLWSQFGVQTMRSAGFRMPMRGVTAEEPKTDTPYSVHTLRDDETIARLRTGIKRFTLPDEFNFIRIYRQVADGPKGPQTLRALRTLAQIYENRRQFPRAAEYWRRISKEYTGNDAKNAKNRLQQIVGNWGRFENATVQPAGRGATVDYRFRNGKQVHFEAYRVDIDRLLADVKAYLKSSPRRVNWQDVDVSNIGFRLVQRNQKQYLRERVAEWDVDLNPSSKHFDRRITVTTPLQRAGVYLLIGKMRDGNISRIIIWIADTVIIRKQLSGRDYYFVADAVTGRPIPEANVEFVGFQVKSVGRNRYTVLTSNFAEFTDADGQVIPDPSDLNPRYRWLVIARTRSGRLAYLGFQGIWYGRYNPDRFEHARVFVITDRPVYRPEQTVKFKFWLRTARYDKPDVSRFAHKRITVRICDPRGKTVFEKAFQTDAFGGLDGEYLLPEEATLGRYSLMIVREKSELPRPVSGGGYFRVEEYKKPEYEVTVEAPKKPVQLGETITATIRAKYYFGAPVTHAKVHYKVYRTSHSHHWYPRDEWDWLYGPGYWWFASAYDWYPGWRRWGCIPPRPFWWPVRPEPPELDAEKEVPIGPHGTVKVVIDTAVAKELHPDQDHQYRITAEVVDQSRRTIVGTGRVLVARQPFQVFAWVDRGYYRVGETIHASFRAQTLDGQPVQGTGKLRLLKITYDEQGHPTETEVQTWPLNPDAQGEARVQLKASQPGQFRLSYTVIDANGRSIEGGYLFIVRGQGFDGSQFRFNDLELVTDKRHYRPGDRVKLLINTNRVGSTVLLFLRPVGGIYTRPVVLRLKGKSTVYEVPVTLSDMPNFFVEAMTIADGKLHTVTRQIVVPPVKRVLKVEVQPSAGTYRPGAAATVRVRLTDLDGRPFTGSLVLTVYDKSVEYISGGSNVPEIREFFWKWRRNHHPRTVCSLDRWFRNLLKLGETPMQNIGVFGYLEPQEHLLFGGAAEAKGSRRREMALQSAPAPKPMQAEAAAGAALAMDARSLRKAKAPGAAAPAAAPEVQPMIRKEFADTAFWAAALQTDENGVAEVRFDMPENLTTWRIRAWAMGHGTNVGQGDAEVVTAKNLLVRLQAPRFFTEKDEVVLSANVHNYLKSAKQVRVVLELDGETLRPLGELSRTVSIAAGDEARVDWRVKAVAPGQAIVRVKALTDEESDAMQMAFPVYVHGMLKMESFSGVIRPGGKAAHITIRVPAERRVTDTRLEVRFSPTLAGAMVDALPYLVNYPYGCTEQTLNRFLPTIIVQNILKRMDLDLRTIREKRTNLNPQEIGDDTQRAKQWKRSDRNPVFDEREVQRMVKQGVKALTEMQLSDGGWGWFSGFGERSYPHTTALVVHGLQLARANRVALVPGVLERGIQWLRRYQDEQVRRIKNAPSQTQPYKLHADNLDALVFIVLVDADVLDGDMLDFLYRDRNHLSVYAKGMFGLALHKIGDRDKLAMILRNIEQYLVEDDENQTAHLKLPESTAWWFWYGSEIEANAYYLKLLARTDPKSRKASRLVKYLLNNRKHATYWNSTRDTAICIEALAEYLTASGEDQPNLTVEIWVDGRKHKQVHVDRSNLFAFDNKLVLQGDQLSAGEHTIELRKAGAGPLYFNAYLTNFTKEDPITRAGLEIKVRRKYYKLVPVDKKVQVSGGRGQVIDQRVEKYRRVPLPNLATLKSGELVEIELEIESKNDYEYLVFEDRKAAGFEPVDVRSGYVWSGLGAYRELRDEKVAFFVRWLARGRHSLSYRMRAEIPGRFSALPTVGYAMYAPELKANSDEIKLVIED
ncbi:MAG: alpha-2-macroglobulin [Planctomycetes bacterium]|nr:alpha-2-macroglobulin [Planctomycetota bacterium]